ncbi:hypothetical protein RyT2_05730 [Pseudolactococcus yaeyamensis]
MMTDTEINRLGRGLLIIYSGPSGVGKGTVRDAVFKTEGNQFEYSVSMTTRSKRPGEIEGKDYFFTNREKFEEKIKDGQILEYSEYVGNFYGTPIDYVEQTLSEGKDIFLEVDIAGARQIKRVMPDSVSIFLAPPDVNELRERLRGRGTESNEIVNYRLDKAIEELAAMGEYDHIVVNADVAVAAEQVVAIIHDRKREKMTDVKIESKNEPTWEEIYGRSPDWLDTPYEKIEETDDYPAKTFASDLDMLSDDFDLDDNSILTDEQKILIQSTRAFYDDDGVFHSFKEALEISGASIPKNMSESFDDRLTLDVEVKWLLEHDQLEEVRGLISYYVETMENAWEQLKADIPELPHDSAFPDAIYGLRFETGVGTWDDELMMLYANDPDNKVFPKVSSYSYSNLTDFLYSPYSDMRQRFANVSDSDFPEVEVDEHSEIAFYTEAESGSEALPTETAQYLKETEILYQKYFPERIEALKRHILNHVQISPEVERQYDDIMAALALGDLRGANSRLLQHNSTITDVEFEFNSDNEGFDLLTADLSGKGFDYAATELNTKSFNFLPSEEAERIWLKTDLQFKRDKKAAEKYIFDNRDKIDIGGIMIQDIAEARFSFEEEGLNIKIGENTFLDNRSFLEALQEQYSDRGLGEDFVQEVEKFAFQDENNQEESTKVEGTSLQFQKTLVETGWIEGKINGQEISDIDYYSQNALDDFELTKLLDVEILALTNNLMQQTKGTFSEISDMAEDDSDLRYWMDDYYNEVETYEKMMSELHSRDICLDSDTVINLFDSAPYDSFFETKDAIEALLHDKFENFGNRYFAVFDEQLNGFKAGMVYQSEKEALEAAAERVVELSQSDDEPCQPEGISNREICEDYGYHVEEVSKREAKVIEGSDNKGLLSTVSTSDLERARITSDEKALRTELIEKLDNQLVGVSSKYENREFLEQSMNKEYSLILSDGSNDFFVAGFENNEKLEKALNEEYLKVGIKPSNDSEVPFIIESSGNTVQQPVGMIAHDLKTNRVEIEAINSSFPNAGKVLERAKVDKISKLMENISNKSKGQVR